MKKKKELTYGDLFYLELPNSKYVAGRVLFDVEKQCSKDGIVVEHENYMDLFGGCQLIEMYKGIYDNLNDIQTFEILIPRVFVFNIDSKSNELPYGILRHEEIDYTKVEFPENIGDSHEKIRLMRGELHFILHDIYEEYPEYDLFPTSQFPITIAKMCLFMQGRKDMIVGEFYDEEGLKDCDLLYHAELREKLYQKIGEDPNKSYYQLAKEHGYDLGRFYK
ncbi:MAG: hypothetical protein LBJ72_12665 [Dysgonamonadaceae bacterium]|nr:hypothetical protein [Dysgonamonadaceae bacterium]